MFGTHDKSGKRKRTYDTDVERLQAHLNKNKQLYFPNPDVHKVKYVKKALVIIEDESANSIEAEELRKALRDRLQDPCPICLTPLTDGMAMQLKCKHLVHSSCIHTWAQEQMEMRKRAKSEAGERDDVTPSCPTCRKLLM